MLIPAGSPAASTNVSGDITVDTHWTPAGSPYVLSGVVTVRNGATLTVDSTVVITGSGYTILVGGSGTESGAMVAVGTAASHVTMTSTSGLPGGWAGITFRSSSNLMTSNLVYCDILNGGGGSSPSLTLDSTNQPTLQHCTISGNAWTARATRMNRAAPTWTDVTFSGNVALDLLLYDISTPTLIGCTFNTGSHRGIDIQDANSAPTIIGCSFSGSADYAVHVPPMSWRTGNSTSGYSRGVLFTGTDITASRTWYPTGPGQSYVLEGDLTVRGGATLTLRPGTTVKDRLLMVGSGATDPGSLWAIGTCDSVITFSSTGGGSGTSGGLRFNDASDFGGAASRLEFCVVENGGCCSLPAMVECFNTTSPVIYRSILRNSGSWALRAYAASPTLDECAIYGNGANHGVYSNGGATVTAVNCWWWPLSGYPVSVTGPLDGSAGAPDFNPAGNGQEVSDFVVYRPWSPAPPSILPTTITASVSGAGGTISPSGTLSLTCGTSQVFTMVPDPCHHVLDVLVNGVSVGPVTMYTLGNVGVTNTIEASFARNSYSVAASAGPGGTITPAGVTPVDCGSNLAFVITPDSCHSVADVQVDGSSVGAVTSFTFHDIQASHTIAATFLSGHYTITATAGPGGTITPSGPVVVACGGDTSFSIAALPGFVVQDVKVDGVSVGPVASHEFTGVSANHSIEALFRDVECPAVHVTFPNGGEEFVIDLAIDLTWSASDNVGVDCVDLLLSRNGVGGPYDTLATCVPNTGTYPWTVTEPPTTAGVFRVVAHDQAGNSCDDTSDAEFTLDSFATPVLLERFSALAVESGLEIRWQLAADAMIVSSHVERGDLVAGPFESLREPARADDRGFVLLDREVQDGRTCYYRLVVTTRSGQSAVFGPLEATGGRPVTELILPPISPNPARGAARIAFSTPGGGRVRVSILDVQGRPVALVADDVFPAGRHEVAWSGESAGGTVVDGIYFVLLEGADRRVIQRVVLLH